MASAARRLPTLRIARSLGLEVSAAARLYTPEVLGLATALAGFPLHDGLILRGGARSAACGSALTLGLALDGGRIADVGVSASACAIGQAAAAIFVLAAKGKSAADVAAAEAAIADWLNSAARGEAAAIPDWPGLGAIAAAAAYPARHGAILLAWRAAAAAFGVEALSNAAAPR